MNISPVSNYNNRQSFGMAFKKPSKEVSELFYDTMRTMSPVERASFVKSVDEIVGRAKTCPVPIEHKIATGYSPHYAAKVGDTTYTYNPQQSTNRANSILDTMNTAVSAAENQHDLNVNQLNLSKILNA